MSGHDNMPLVIMCPYMVFETIRLKNILAGLPDCPTKTRLLQSSVLSCNYTVTSICHFWQRVKNVYSLHIQSSLSLQEHFQLYRLKPHCEIGLTPQGARRLSELITQVE
jgi:hypothetical protein